MKEKKFVTKAGITYFSRRTERVIFFFLTLAMFVWLAADKLF